ncbi:MAG: bifunctional UDP-sugar hydrolase/5'-nucleotidase [Desulfobaccales bacterium]
MRTLRTLIAILILLVLGVAPLAAGDGTLRLLHVNDFHGFAEPHRPLGSLELQGGAAYLAGAVKRLRAARPSLLLAAGDMIQGDNWANLFQGASVIELMNAMGFDAMVVGNHEFDFGVEVLKERIRQAVFPILGANVQGLPGLKPYIVKKVGGVRVAVLGVVTPDTPHATHPRNVTGLTFADPVATVREYLPRLRQEADLVVVLSHLGYAEDRKLAQAVPGIDVIVGGHSHTRLERPEKVNGTWLVQAYEHGNFLGVLDLTVRRGRVTAVRGRLMPIGPGLGPADPKILALVKKYQQRVDDLLNVVVGEAAVDLDAERARLQETALGNLVADIMRERTGADAALLNGGTLRASIPKGPVTRKQIYTALPFDNYLVAFRLTGAQVRQALEHGVAGLPEREGRFPQVSGLRFAYRATAPPGSRVVEVEVGGQPLEPAKVYVLATHDFLAAGGDGYTVFGEVLKEAGLSSTGGMLQSGALAYNDPGTYLRDLVLAYFERHSPVTAAVEGRIQALP